MASVILLCSTCREPAEHCTCPMTVAFNRLQQLGERIDLEHARIGLHLASTLPPPAVYPPQYKPLGRAPRVGTGLLT